MTLNLVEIALAIAVATAGSLIQASVGYGIGLVLMPGIVLGYMASPLFARFLDRDYLRPAIWRSRHSAHWRFWCMAETQDWRY